jgi:hypothetical protein
MTRFHRIRSRVTWTALAVLIFAWGLVTFWMVRPYNDISATPFTTTAQSYAPGDTIVMSNTFCWDGTPFRSERVLVGIISENELGAVRFPRGYVLPEIEAAYTATGCNDTTVRVQIPVTQPPGRYLIRYETAYKPRNNPVRVVTFNVESNEFNISAR